MTSQHIAVYRNAISQHARACPSPRTHNLTHERRAHTYCSFYFSLTEARARERNLSEEFLARLLLVSCCRPAALAGRLVPVTPVLAPPPCAPATEVCRDGDTVEGGGLRTYIYIYIHVRHVRQYVSSVNLVSKSLCFLCEFACACTCIHSSMQPHKKKRRIQ